MPLAAIIWLVIIWAFGFLLTSPKVEVPPPPPIEASFVELPEEKPATKVGRHPAEGPKGTSSTPSLSRVWAFQNRNRRNPFLKRKAPPDEAPAQLHVRHRSPKDMMAYMNEARERRRAGGIFEDEPTEPKKCRAPAV